jgi:hypothetical protein
MYDFNALFLYKFQFLLELLIAEGLFCIHLKRRNKFVLRLILSLIGVAGITFAIPIASYNPFYMSLIFIIIFIATVALVAICFDESIINCIYCCTAGYILQHIAFCAYQCFMVATLIDGGKSLDMYGSGTSINAVVDFISYYIYLIFYVIVYVLGYILFAKKIKNQKDFYITNLWLFILVIIVFASAVILNSVMVDKYEAKTDQVALVISFIYGMISCLLVLILQLQLKDAKNTQKELEIVQTLWKSDKEHYELAKENIDIINIKCHDLKQQISAIRHGGNIDAQDLKEIEKSVMIYGAIIKTGNDALDVVLTEKSLTCNKNNITLTYIVDGEKLNFMSTSNIYSLFGNAIDNAIEYLLKINPEKRFIRLYAKNINDMVSIHIENYFEGNLEYNKGLPVTTKQDTGFHGYGTLSMKKIVESYNGEMFIKTKNNLFIVDILLPIPKESTKK